MDNRRRNSCSDVDGPQLQFPDASKFIYIKYPRRNSICADFECPGVEKFVQKLGHSRASCSDESAKELHDSTILRKHSSFLPYGDQSFVVQTNWKHCAEAISSLAKYVFSKRDGFDWIPVETLEKIYKLLHQLVHQAECLKNFLRISPRPLRGQSFRCDQAALMVKTIALVLSRSAGDLLRAVPLPSEPQKSNAPFAHEAVSAVIAAQSHSCTTWVVNECLQLTRIGGRAGRATSSPTRRTASPDSDRCARPAVTDSDRLARAGP